ncbi:MAG: hypothetical protein ACFB0C_19495 [Leptolyngbyaceae cyanobacterium]
MMHFVAYGRTAIIQANKFLGGEPPRNYIETPQIQRSPYGTPNRTGTAYEPPHLFQINAVVDTATRDILRKQRNRHMQAPGPWLIYDYTEPFSEASPRTRALAPNASETIDGDDVIYYAQFRAELQGTIRLSQLGMGWHQFEATFIETTKVPV